MKIHVRMENTAMNVNPSADVRMAVLVMQLQANVLVRLVGRGKYVPTDVHLATGAKPVLNRATVSTVRRVIT